MLKNIRKMKILVQNNRHILFLIILFALTSCIRNNCNCPPYNITLKYESDSDVNLITDQITDSLKYLFYVYNCETDLIMIRSPGNLDTLNPLETCVLFEGQKCYLDSTLNRALTTRYYFGFWHNNYTVYLNSKSHLGEFKYIHDTAIYYNCLAGLSGDFWDPNWKRTYHVSDSIFRKKLLENKYDLNPWLKEELDKRGIKYKKRFFF